MSDGIWRLIPKIIVGHRLNFIYPAVMNLKF